MSESHSIKIRFAGSCAGLVVGVVLGILIGMGFNSIFLRAVIGGSIGLILGFCFPNVAAYIFGGLIDIP
jgi:F0F1-type ATP synthase assembly protein I